MDILAFDLSKASTGWARWSDDQARPTFGSKCLGSEYTSRGDTYVALHKLIIEMTLFGTPDHIVVEAPRNPTHLPYPTKFLNDRQLIGLAEMAHYFAAMLGCTVREVETKDWWPHFNRQGFPKRVKGSSSKDYTIARCRQFGFKPKNDDEADAIGILSYEMEMRGVLPPWVRNEILVTPLGLIA